VSAGNDIKGDESIGLPIDKKTGFIKARTSSTYIIMVSFESERASLKL
jgi:hypothetical protein